MDNIISAVISAIVAVVICLINNRNSGKKLEEFKNKLEIKNEQKNKTIDLYKHINYLMYDVNQGFQITESYINHSNHIEDDFTRDHIFVPNEIADKIKTFITDFNAYIKALENLKDFKESSQKLSRSEYNEQSNKYVSDIATTKKQSNVDFNELTSMIKKEFNFS